MNDRRIARGIYWTPHGWRLYVSVKGEQRPKRIHDPAHEQTIDDLKDALAKWGVEARAPKAAPTEGTVFEQDVETYLAAVASMPTIKDRTLHMQEWAALFYGRARNDVTPIDVRTRLEALRQTHAASSCNHRRTALMSFYTLLNGKIGYNPVREIRKYDEDEEPRDQSLWTIYRILALMRPSRTRARLRVMTWTGWPHKTLGRVKETHVDFTRQRAWVTRRRKGRGHPAAWLPLLPGAIIALKDLQKHDGFGPFSKSSLYKSFELALGKYNAHRKRFGHAAIEIRPYDIRHSFGTWIADHLEDDRVLNALMQHSRPEQSRRYTKRATERRLERGIGVLRAIHTSGRSDVENRRNPSKSVNQKSRDSGRKIRKSTNKTGPILK